MPLEQVTGITLGRHTRAWASTLQRPARWVVGEHTGSTYRIGRWLFLRCLGVVYLVAFLSLGSQVTGLLGAEGILPARAFLRAVGAYYPGLAHWHLVPSLCWLGAGDGALRGLCLFGAGASVLLILNVAPPQPLPTWTAWYVSQLGAWWTRRLLGLYSPVLSLGG